MDQGKPFIVTDGGPRGQNRTEHLRGRKTLPLREKEEGKKDLGIEAGSSPATPPWVFILWPQAARFLRETVGEVCFTGGFPKI